MSRSSTRWAVIAFALVAVIGLAGLVYAAARDERPVAFSLDIPPVSEVKILTPGQAACEAPILTTVAYDAIQIFLVPAAVPGAEFDLTVRDFRSRAILATGRLPSGYTTRIAPVIGLTSTVPVGRRVIVCLRSRGPRRVAVLGAPARDNGGFVQTVAGKKVGDDVELIFLRPHPRTLLSLIPTVFDRAALFHPSWVGAWTFWLLTGALLLAFALAGGAVAQAARRDARGSEESVEPRRQ